MSTACGRIVFTSVAIALISIPTPSFGDSIINVPGSSFTEANGINNAGEIVGTAAFANGLVEGFSLMNGTFTPIIFPGAAQTYASGVNDSGQIVGTYTTNPSNPTYQAFVLNAGIYSTISVPGGVGSTFANGINNSGTIVGASVYDSKGDSQGFMRDSSGNYTFLNVLGGSSTSVNGINNNGDVVGGISLPTPNGSYTGQGFEITAGGTLTNINVSGAAGAGTVALGINDLGQIVGGFTNGSLLGEGFLYATGTYQSYLFPGSTYTQVQAINNNGLIVGDIQTPGASAIPSGFLGNITDFSSPSGGGSPPVPEPSSFALLGLGGIGLAIRAYRRRRMAAV